MKSVSIESTADDDTTEYHVDLKKDGHLLREDVYSGMRI